MLIIYIAISFPAQRAARRCCNQKTLRRNIGINKGDGSPALTELYLKQELNFPSPNTHTFCSFAIDNLFIKEYSSKI